MTSWLVRAALGLPVLLVASAFAPERGLDVVVAPYAVQFTEEPGGDSPWVGRVVTLEGVVTGVQPHGQFYYVASPSGGPWSGVKVEGPALERRAGQWVLLDGLVVEEFGETRVRQRTVYSPHDGVAPEPTPVTAADLLADGERWEGVLVRVSDVSVVGETSRFGEFPIADGSGSGVLVDDEFFTSYIADPGDAFDSIAGIVSYGFSNFRIEPRGDADLVGFVSGRGFDSVLHVSVREESGRPMPGKVTFFPIGGGPLELGPDDRAEGSADVAYIPVGGCDVRIPAGTYDLAVSRGIEYSLFEARVSVGPGADASVDAILHHDVSTDRWISGDFHLHSAPSSDTPLPVHGRILSLAGEGVEWAIATDHNMVTDYAPVIEELGLGDWMRSSIGDEITTRSPNFGHFNAWPLEPGVGPLPFEGLSPDQLFAGARSGPFREIVQVNHPVVDDWGDQYFQTYAVNPITGEPENPGFSFDFDALEIMNGNFVDQGIENFETWMSMLNNGRRITATGNSDSHHLVFREPGYPRNYVATDPGPFSNESEEALVEAVRAGRVFVTYGPILDFHLNGAGLGEQVATVEGEVRATVRVRCVSWMNASSATLYANSRPLATIALAPGDGVPQDVTVAWSDRPTVDTWYLVFVDGDEDLSPVRRGFGFRPLAFTNPIRVDVDGDGVFTPPGNLASVEPVGDVDGVDEQGVPVRLGEFVAVVGCATTDTRFGDPSSGVFYLEDETGGIRCREQVETTTDVHRGDTVWVGGVLSQQLGETFLTDAQVDVLKSSAVCPEGIPVTTGEIAAGVEALEGRVVRVTGANATSGSWPVGGAEGAVVLDDGSGAVSLVIPAGVVVPAEANDLANFELTALVSQRDFTPPFTSGYRLMLRNGADLFDDGRFSADRAGLEGVRLGRPHPNPFRERVTIPVFAAPSPNPVKIEIVDVTGRRVSELLVPPNGQLGWDGTDSRGRRVPAGVYFVRPAGDARVGASRIVKLD